MTRQLSGATGVAIAVLLAGCGAVATSTTASAGFPSTTPNPTTTGTPAPTGAAATVIAGTGESGWSGDGGPAIEATLNYTVGMAFLPDGSLVFADAEANVVRRIDASGVISTIAGTGVPGYGGDGGPATSAQLSSPDDLAVGPDGSIYVADSVNNRVRRIGPDGVIRTVAGTGKASNSGDGGPATAASVQAPDGLAVAADGTLDVSSPGRVRRIGLDGIIETIAGSGGTSWDPAADGGPALEASFADASSIEIGPDGSVYLADFLDCRILRIDRAGLLTSVAGTGCSTFDGISSGDGGPATAAELARPADLAFTDGGDLLVIEHFGSVRRINPDGVITTVPIAWRWKSPLGMALHGSDLYIGDRDHHLIIRTRVD